MSKLKRLCDYIIKIHFYDDTEDISFIDQLFATRILLSLFSLILIIIILFTTFTLQTHSVTIKSSSEYLFKQLSFRYSSTLSCSSSQTSIRHSQFVNQSFISSLSDVNKNKYHWKDYRIIIASHFQILALLCQIIQRIITDSLNEFYSEEILTTQVLTQDIFDAQVEQLVERLKARNTADMKYKSDTLWLNILQNGIYTGFRTNYAIFQPLETTNLYSSSIIYINSNSTFTCQKSIGCTQQAAFYDSPHFVLINSSLIISVLVSEPRANLLFRIPNMMIGYLPYTSLLQSTLGCFYN
ncbi:hypothetical protein I4U23_015820 [Adineta vaga]|nr:hypothetical protein I4U23_015820 [Adineta vaga]